MTDVPPARPNTPRLTLLEAVERASSTGLAAVDDSGAQIYVNPAFCAMVGYSAEELLGKRPPFAYWPPDALGDIERALKLTVEGKAPANGFELPFVRKSGERFLARLKIAPLNTNKGEHVGFLASLEDVTEHKAFEEARARLAEEQHARAREGASRRQLENVLDALPVGVMIAQSDGNVAYTNSAAMRIFGGPIDDPGTADQYEHAFRAWDPDGKPLASNDFPLVRALKGESVEGQEVTFETPSGERRTVRANAAPIRDDEGRVAFAVTAYYDITERRARDLERAQLLQSEQTARREAEMARRDAEAASRAKDEFLAMLGHELRNPLAPIVTALELLRREETIASRPLAVIERQVGHMVRLVDDLLDVSRITRGKVELRNERLGLNNVLVKAIEMVRPLVDSRAQTVRIDARVPDAFIDGDPARLAQVFANVLTNSAKYSNPGTEIRIALAEEGDRAVVRVADRGSGIASELLPRVFEPFVQGPQSLDRSRGGLGLGLAIVKNLVELHGGMVEVTSEGKGLGAEVTIRLPLAHEEPEVVPPPPSSLDPSGAPLHVLVVDDNEDAVALLVEVLGSMGHRVDVSYDGLAALDAIVRGSHDVVLLDIGLPGLDGYEVARRVRQAGRPVRLVALTGYGRDNDKQMTHAAGFDAHLVKPVDFGKLARALRPSA